MLSYFILGALFLFVGVPLLQSILSIINAWSEYRVYNFAFKVYKIKQQMYDDQDKQQDNKKIPMGFQTDAIGISIEDPEEFQEEE